MRQILITGGGGFIGSHLAEFYAQHQETNEITIIDNLSRANLLNQDLAKKFLYNWNLLHRFDNIQFIRKNLRDLGFLKQLFRKKDFDIVFHTAGQTSADLSVKNPYTDFQNNLEPSLNLLEAIRRSGRDPKVLYCSTNKVYGTKVNDLPLREGEYKYHLEEGESIGISEDAGIDQTQHTPYGVSKLGADLYFQDYGYTYGLKIGVFRMSSIYGPRQMGAEPQGWVSHFIIAALANESLKIYGSGKQTRDILYIDDLIDAFDQYISSNINNEVFCIGGGIENAISPMKLINILQNKLDKSISYEFFDWREGDQKYFVSDITKAKKTLGWSPQTSIEQGLHSTLKWYKNHLDLFI